MKKVLEARKREKEEEKIARQRVREQIEADKAARRAKAAGETAKPEAQPAPPVPVSPPPQRDYSQTRLQVTHLLNYWTILFVISFEFATFFCNPIFYMSCVH